MDRTLGIIIPIFNSGKYLKETLKSISEQTFKDWNCYLIDDASTDPLTIKTIQAYLNNDNRFHLYHNCVNLGVSSSRNKGIEISNDKYLTFVDHDDTLNKVAYEKSLAYFNDKINWVGFGQIRSDGKNTWIKKEDKRPSGNYELLNSPRYLFVWNKIYKTDIIKNNNIYFYNEQPNIPVVGEDNCFNILYSAYAPSGYFTNELFYKHFYHSNSLNSVNQNDNLPYRQLTSFLILRNDLIRRNKPIPSMVTKRIERLISIIKK